LFPQEARNKALRFQNIRHFLTSLDIRQIQTQTPHYTGVFDPDEEPLKPDLVSFSDSKTLRESARKVLGLLIDSGYLPRETPVRRRSLPRARGGDTFAPSLAGANQRLTSGDN
jgi:hypothetical protein